MFRLCSLLCLCVSCASVSPETVNGAIPKIQFHNRINYNFLSDVASIQTQSDLEKRFGLTLTSFGGGAAGALQRLSLGFELNKQCTIEEARRIIVESSIVFRNNIDSIRMLRPAMCSYPFPMQKLSLVIFLIDPKTHQDFPHGTLMKCKLFNGKVLYQTNDEKNKILSLKEETFEEALCIVEQERKEQGLSPLTIPAAQINEIPLPAKIPEPKIGSSLKQEIKTIKFLDTTFCQLGEKYTLKYACKGDFSDTTGHALFGVSLFGLQALSLEETKQLTHALFSEYYRLMQTNEEIKDYYTWERSKRATDFPLLSELCFKITFWDKDMNPQLPPNIAQVTFLNEKFSYYQADPVTHELTLVLEEPYVSSGTWKRTL